MTRKGIVLAGGAGTRAEMCRAHAAARPARPPMVRVRRPRRETREETGAGRREPRRARAEQRLDDPGVAAGGGAVLGAPSRPADQRRAGHAQPRADPARSAGGLRRGEGDVDAPAGVAVEAEDVLVEAVLAEQIRSA